MIKRKTDWDKIGEQDGIFLKIQRNKKDITYVIHKEDEATLREHPEKIIELIDNANKRL